jgi:hypothetical protein
MYASEKVLQMSYANYQFVVCLSLPLVVRELT